MTELFRCYDSLFFSFLVSLERANSLWVEFCLIASFGGGTLMKSIALHGGLFIDCNPYFKLFEVRYDELHKDYI